MRDNLRQKPLTSQFVIPGTSYSLQLRLNKGKLVILLLKGTNIFDSYILKDENVEGVISNINLIVGWVLGTLAIPNINPSRVMMTVQALIKQVSKKKSDHKNLIPLLSKQRSEHGRDDDFFPYPFIFKPPTPPGDIGSEGQLLAKEPDITKEHEIATYCKYCGGILPNGESICHVCGNKVI